MDIKQLLRDGALVHQSARAEQQMQALEALARQQSEYQVQQEHLMRGLYAVQTLDRAVAERQRQFKQTVFNLRQEAEAALGNPEPLARCMLLLDAKEHATALDLSELDDIQDKQYHADTLKLVSNGYDAAAKELGENVPKALETLRTSLREVHDIATSLAHYNTILRGHRPGQGDIGLWRMNIRNLKSAVMKAEEAASAIPGFPLDALPLGKVVAAARGAFLEPASIDEFTFKCLVLIAKADGKMESSELGLLAELGCWFRIHNHEVERLIQETRSVKKSEFQGDRQTAERVLQDLYRCAAIDGRISPREQKMIEKIGLAIGVPAEAVADIIAGVGVDARITILDPVATQAAFASAPDNARKKAYIGNTVPGDLLAWFRKEYAISDDETPVIARNWGSLRSRFRDVLLTQRRVYLYTGGSKNYRIPVEDILTFAPGFWSGKLNLKGGTTVKTSTCMNDFLQALVQAVTAGRRSI